MFVYEYECGFMNNASKIEDFRKAGYQLIDQLSDYLSESLERTQPVIDLHEPQEELKYWASQEITDLSDFHEKLFARSIRLHHPHYIGHQVSAPEPEIALLGLTSDLMNNGMGIYEMGAAAVAMEHVVIKTFAEHIGYQTDLSNGFLTSGGTLANLTALLAARAKFYQKHPNIDINNAHILVSEQAHFCIDRAWTTMGMNADNLHKISVNDAYQVDIAAMEVTVKSILAQPNQQIMAIVGCACSTATGSYDDIAGLSALCQHHNIWLHIDGAHGGAATFSPKLKAELLSHIDKADSIIIDAHKMMLTPALATAVLFKDHMDGYNSFKQQADYLFDQSKIDADNLAKRTYETTKLMMSIKVYYLLKKYGPSYIADFVERQTDLARWFYDHLSDQENYECAHRPQTNILCFRYIGGEPSQYDELNQYIRDQLLKSGKYYIVSTRLQGAYYLRVTIMNPATTQGHLIELTCEINQVASAYPNS
jgi:L-2,4-diaminobutyrate decarboxylase